MDLCTHWVLVAGLLCGLLPTNARLQSSPSEGAAGLAAGGAGAMPTMHWSNMQVTIASHRVFRFAFNPKLFHWSEGNYGGLEGTRPEYRYTPTLRDSADLPGWMKYKYSKRHKAGFIYGVPPKSGVYLDLDVVALNLHTFEYGLFRLAINVTEAPEPTAKFAVKLKIDNLNLEDIFDTHRLRNLKGLFSHHLWLSSAADLHLTQIHASPDLGYRRPLNPALKDGAVVFLGSAANFSEELLELDRETYPLRRLPSCPRDFKRTSVERHFRAKGFALDWCEFRLLTWTEEGEFREVGYVYGREDNNSTEHALDPAQDELETASNFPEDKTDTVYNMTNLFTDVDFPDRSSLPEADYSSLYLQTLLPALAGSVVLSLLAVALFCCKCPGETREERWHGLVASFFLVLKDCWTCCEPVQEKQKLQHSLGPAAELRQSEDEFSVKLSGEQAPHSRYQRAASVQRQSDTLRRLAQQRDVANRLRDPAGDAASAAASYVHPADRMDFGEYLPPAEVVAPPPPPPVVMLPEEQVMLGEQPYMASPQGSPHSRRAHLVSRPYDPLGSLPRPIPPPYYGTGSGPSSARQSVHVEDDGTYLV